MRLVKARAKKAYSTYHFCMRLMVPGSHSGGCGVPSVRGGGADPSAPQHGSWTAHGASTFSAAAQQLQRQKRLLIRLCQHRGAGLLQQLAANKVG